jgi:hypothetical protein
MRAMRKLFLFTALVSSIVVLTGCPKKKTEEVEAGSTEEAGAEAPATTDAAPSAVARFQAETKIENEAAKVASSTIARNAPKGGNTVATLKAQTDVTKIATYQDMFLVTFASPSDPTVTLMGWIGKEAFTAVSWDGGVRDGGVTDGGAVKDGGIVDAGAVAVVDAGKAPLKCAANQVAVVLGAEPTCRKKCVTDADCTGGAKGSCGLAAAAVGGKATHVCVRD